MSKKNCAFQYATPRQIYADTGLITKERAQELWDSHLPQFVKDVEEGREPEMAIWVNMKDSGDYHTAEKNLNGADCIIRDGKIYAQI